MPKALITTLLLVGIAWTQAMGQGNVLDTVGINGISISQWQEYRGAHYFLSRRTVNRIGPQGRIFPASAFRMVKARVNSLSFAQSVPVFGDTVQVDSIIHPELEQAMVIANGRIHLFYNKNVLVDSTTVPIHRRLDLYYRQLDTNLNTIIGEMIIDTSSTLDPSRIPRISVQFATAINSRVLVNVAKTNFQSTEILSRYYLLNPDGTVHRVDTFGDKNSIAARPLIRAYVGCISQQSANRFLVSGTGLADVGKPVFLMVDSNLQVLDTFYFQDAGFIPNSQPPAYYVSPPFVQFLPNGSIVSGGTAYYDQPPSGTVGYPVAMALHRPSTRFQSTRALVLARVDSNDFGRTSTGYQGLVYQPADNSIYLASTTHGDQYSSGMCNGSYNFLEITCTDTALNVKWRKFIPSGQDVCNYFGRLAACDGRSGVIVVGTRYSTLNPRDTTYPRDFAYRIDSTGMLSVVSGPTDGAALRDRIALFPNPAHETFTVSDVFGKLALVQLYDARGAVVHRQNLSGRYGSVSVSFLPTGIYLARVRTTDGENVSLRVVVN